MVIDIEISTLIQVSVMVVSVVGSYFLLRERIIILEERCRKYEELSAITKEALYRIEDKLDKRD